MDHPNLSVKHDLVVLRRILRSLIFSYGIGWVVLVFNVGRIPLLNPIAWEAASAVCLFVTIWLAWSLSIRSLTIWTAVIFSVVTMRSFAYISDGIFNPLGVWMLVMSGVSVTGLAVISVNAITGNMEEMRQ
jgi:hypothetical protein